MICQWILEDEDCWVGFGLLKKWVRDGTDVLDDVGWWMVDIWKLDIKNEQLAKNMFRKLIRSPNAKKLSTLFCGLHFYPTKTTIKLNQNKILGLFNLPVCLGFPKSTVA